eukprot:scaffold1954_cov268-Pinguiococcus_pyrenoidosus.AAC.145
MTEKSDRSRDQEIKRSRDQEMPRHKNKSERLLSSIRPPSRWLPQVLDGGGAPNEALRWHGATLTPRCRREEQ